MMEFADEAHRTGYESVKRHMLELYGEEQVYLAPDAPLISIFAGSAEVRVYVMPWNGSAAVNIHSWVVTDVEPTRELLEYLLRENHELLLGAFNIDRDNDVLFSYVLQAGHLTKDDLRGGIAAVRWSADHYDDEIVSRFGGLRAKDRYDQQQRRSA
jgi:hypothetical protein